MRGLLRQRLMLVLHRRHGGRVSSLTTSISLSVAETLSSTPRRGPLHARLWACSGAHSLAQTPVTGTRTLSASRLHGGGPLHYAVPKYDSTTTRV